MRLARPFLALLLVSLAAAPVASQGTDAITKLEAARNRTPQSVAALRGLGIAYYKAKRYADARTVLDQARQLDPKDGVSALYTGLAAEQLGDLTSARRAYETYLNVGTTRRAKSQIRTRLVALSRQESIASAKAAVANEATISRTPGSTFTVAVPPLRFSGSDSTLKPLERGMADLLITDLSRSARLTVVERDRMQALADEIQLSQTARVDAATAVRAGKLMQAGTLVNGIIQQTGANQISLDASLVNVSTGAIGAPAQVTNSLDQLFDMEKRLVFQLFERIGVALTPAERQLVERRPTNNLQAFLAYSRGLMAMDDGRVQDAARFFESARALDPGFLAATQRGEAAAAAVGGEAVSAATIESSVSTGPESRTVTAAVAGRVAGAPPQGGLTNTINNVTRDVNPPTISTVTTTIETTVTAAPSPPRVDPVSNAAGTDKPTRTTGQVVLIIRRP